MRHPPLTTALAGVVNLLDPNAIVLGGDTEVGESSVIGGSVFLTNSVPKGCTVTIKTPELSIRKSKAEREKDKLTGPVSLDFQI